MDLALTLPTPRPPSPAPPTPAAASRSLRSLSDDELLRRVVDLTQQSRRIEADLVAHLAEVDERRLYARFAHPSMFAYCAEALHLSEAEAYLRIAAARASREHPVLLDMLRDGRLHLTAISLLAPHLTPESRDAVLTRAAHKSRRQVEELVAELAPGPEAPSLIRRLPQRTRPAARRQLCSNTVGASTPIPDAQPSLKQPLRPSDRPGSSAPPRQTSRPSIEPIAPARYKVQFTASASLRDKLERLRALMRTSVPDGDLAALIEVAVTEKLERLEARRFGGTRAPRHRGPRPLRATSPLRSGERSSSATGAAAATRTRTAGDAPRARGWSCTTGVPSRTAATTRSRTSASCVEATTDASPSRTMDVPRSTVTGDRPSRRDLGGRVVGGPRREARRGGGSHRARE